MKLKRTSYPSCAALIALVGALALPAASWAGADTLMEINKACSPGVDLGAWIGAQGAVTSDLGGNWALRGSLGNATLDGFSSVTERVNDTILVEDIKQGGAVVIRSVTGHDAASGKQVSLWADARDGSCTKLVGTYTVGSGGNSASREMADPAGVKLSIAYARTASEAAPTGPGGAGAACIPGQKFKPGTQVLQCANGDCKSDGKCP